MRERECTHGGVEKTSSRYSRANTKNTREYARKRENNAIIRLTWLRVSSLLRDGHRNERHTTSALPPDPLIRSSKPFRVVKIVCRVLVVRRLCRRRGGAHHHHSRRGGKHDFNEGERVLSFSREEYAFQAGVLSRLSRGSHETRKQSK